MVIKLLFSGLLSLSLLACQAQKKNSSAKKNTATAQKSQTSKVYKLAEGENMFIKEAEMNVTFNKIIEDSRCPEGTNCVWAGVAVADLTLMGTYTRPYHVQVSTADFPSRNYAKTANFNGYNIQLQSVTPGKTAAAKGGGYVITFTLAKGNADTVTSRTGVTTK